MAFRFNLAAVRRKIAQIVRGSSLAARARRGVKRLLIQPLRRVLGTACLAEPISVDLTEMHRALNSLLRGMISLLEVQDQQSQDRLTTHTQILRHIEAVKHDIIGLTEQLERIRQGETRAAAMEADPLRLLVREPADNKACRKTNRLSA